MNTSSTNSIDYVVTQKKEGKYLIGQILIYIFDFAVFVGVFALLAAFIPGIMAAVAGIGLAVPAFLIAFHGTRTICNFDRKYSIFTPNVTMDKTPHTVISFEIVKDRKKADPDKRDVVLECELRRAEFFGPYTEEYKAKYTDPAVKKTIDFRSTVKATDVYFGVFPADDGSKTVVIFETVNKIVEKLAYYNKEATVVVPMSK